MPRLDVPIPANLLRNARDLDRQGEITFDKGRVVQSNFHDYRMLRMSEAPLIEVTTVPSTQLPGGLGETGTSALANAVFAATGTRVRKLAIAQAVKSV